jgi:hypothetical protein
VYKVIETEEFHKPYDLYRSVTILEIILVNLQVSGSESARKSATDTTGQLVSAGSECRQKRYARPLHALSAIF